MSSSRAVVLLVLSVLVAPPALWAGVLCLRHPRRMAEANDTRGPKWVRDYGEPAYPGRTNPKLVVLAGLIGVAAGVLFAATAVYAVAQLAG